MRSLGLTFAWADLRPVLSQIDFRMLVAAVMLVFPTVIVIDVVAGLLKYKGYGTPEMIRFFRISEQGSLGEYVGYIATQMAVIFIIWVAFRLMSSLHVLLAALLEYLVLDDMFTLHEAAGRHLAASYFSDWTMFPPQAVGELSFGLGFCVVAVLVVVAAARVSTPYHKSLCTLLLLPICLLAFCAVGVDFVHALVPREAKYLDGIMALIEDGGELFAMLLLMLIAAAEWIALPWIAPQRQSLAMSP